MLSFEEKIAYFEHCLENQNRNYHDTMKDEIYLYFFELENGNFDFLNTLKTQDEIRNKVDFLVSKMVMHEHEDGLYNIIENYID